jgi:hypothetical protein
LKQAVVRDDDQRVDLLAELGDPGLSLLGPLAPLEVERTRDDADRESLELLASDLGDDGRRTRPGAPAFAGGDEDHVRALEGFLHLVFRLERRLLADGRVGAGAQPARAVGADVELLLGLGHEQGLRVCVDRDELAAPKACLDHPVHGVRSAAAGTDDLDDGEIAPGLVSHLCFLSSFLKLTLSVRLRLRPVREYVKPVFAGKKPSYSNPQPKT